MEEKISLENKVVLVTGASGFIGSAIAQRLAEFGADVFVHYKNSKETAVKTLQIIHKMERRAYLINADLSSENDIQAMFKQIEQTTGKLDILINNAGIQPSSYVKKLKEEDWDEVMDINLKSTYLCTKYAVKLLSKSNCGCIVNMASTCGVKPYVTFLSYCASKASIIEMTKGFAKNLGRYGIRVNSISPGYVKPKDVIIEDENESWFLAMIGKTKVLNVKDETELINLTPLHRVATTEDVSNAVIFLCSRLSKGITGVNLLINGGYTL